MPTPRASAVVIALAVAGLRLTAAEPFNSARAWTFDEHNQRQGWSVTPRARGVVMGGSLWLSFEPGVTDPGKLAETRYQIYGDAAYGLREPGYDLVSPRNLGLPAGKVNKIRLRLLNLSPVTDAWLRWRTVRQPDAWAGSVRFTLRPDLKEWQEVTIHVDSRWSGIIDQIALRFPSTRIRGDLWIDSIEIGSAPARPTPARPDVTSTKVVPRVRIPGIAQNDFADAFRVLDECLILDVPVQGFTEPVMGPGGAYGENWWQLDSSLTLAGAKWANQSFAEGVIRGFHSVQAQNPDGRIDLYGGSAARGQVGDASSLPTLLEIAYDVARRGDSTALRDLAYDTMRRYLDWWLSPVKRDPATGLISGTFEESFGEPDHVRIPPQSLAPVDLNVAVAVGCQRTAALARALGKQEDARRYSEAFDALKAAINRLLWNQEQGAYYNYHLREQRPTERLIVSTFDPLRCGIAGPERTARLLKRLLDPAQFNWGKLPLASLARTDPGFVEARGPYDGTAWFGDVWTLRNMTVVAGLKESGRPSEAAELNWATIRAFHRNWSEYLVPSTGEGQGVKRYGWSASQYIQAIIETLFGVDDDRLRRRLTIRPHVPRELYNQDLAIENLILPSSAGNTRLSLTIRQQDSTHALITTSISGPLPDGTLEISLPGAPCLVTTPVRRAFQAGFPMP